MKISRRAFLAGSAAAGALTVLPREQVYPSLYGTNCQGRHFYETEDELVSLLTALITSDTCGHICSLDRDVDGFCWDNLVPAYDRLITRVAERGRIWPDRKGDA